MALSVKMKYQLCLKTYWYSLEVLPSKVGYSSGRMCVRQTCQLILWWIKSFYNIFTLSVKIKCQLCLLIYRCALEALPSKVGYSPGRTCLGQTRQLISQRRKSFYNICTWSVKMKYQLCLKTYQCTLEALPSKVDYSPGRTCLGQTRKLILLWRKSFYILVLSQSRWSVSLA